MSNWQIVEPTLDYSVRKLCCRPYPLHKNGCPNFRKKSTCPPKYPLLQNLIDMNKEIWAIWNKFPIGEHMNKMKLKHPEWTERQLRNVLYWQPTARKELKNIIKLFLKENNLIIVQSPEAAGVNLTDTMSKIGIKLEWPPQKWAYQIVLAGFKIES